VFGLTAAGSQYTAVHFTETLQLHGLSPSIGTVGDYDNALAETNIELYNDRMHPRRLTVSPRTTDRPQPRRGHPLQLGALVQHQSAHAQPRPTPTRRGRLLCTNPRHQPVVHITEGASNPGRFSLVRRGKVHYTEGFHARRYPLDRPAHLYVRVATCAQLATTIRRDIPRIDVRGCIREATLVRCRALKTYELAGAPHMRRVLASQMAEMAYSADRISAIMFSEAQHAKRTAILDDTIVEIVNHLNVARTVVERASRPGGIDRGTSGAANNLPSQPR
jgi:hypothetical protein